jgi:iron complex outermembrane receptor protein
MGAYFRRSLWFTAVLLFLGVASAFAQTGNLTGRITEAGTGTPIAGARVDALDAAGQPRASAASDADGQFRLANLQAGSYALVVTMVGYTPARIEGVQVIAGQTSMQAVTLNPAAFSLNPIVVSASKRQEKALDAPATVAVVDSRAVAERPATTPVDHLRSVPGIDIMNNGIQSTNVVVRGFNNVFSGSLHALTDNRIAGVPSLRVNTLHFIPANDDDIERMEVVLGPGAALYGPNTADGVLHIMTKSPLDAPGSSFSVAGGGQSVLQGTFRSAHRLSDNFGVKLSGQYLQAKEWTYHDPVERTEAEKFAADPFFKQDLMRAAGINEGEADRRIARIGNRDFDVRRYGFEARADWRPSEDASVIWSAGTSLMGNGIELTGLGAAQASDWRYSFVQTRANWKRLFVQGYVNASNAGDTYLLRNGAPIVDRSKLYVGQIQHGFALGGRQNFTYGTDYIYTNPITEGSINGKYEDEDQTKEFGAYLQSETALHPKLNLVLAGRMDHHSALPDWIFSPRAALVFRPAESQAFRLTFNRAFSTPSSLNQFLDLGSAIPNDLAARLGYSLRVQGTGTKGFSFRQGDGYQMRSPFTSLAMGGPGQLLPAGAAPFFPAAVEVLAQQALAAGKPIDPQMLAYLRTLKPTGTQIGTDYRDLATGQMGSLASLSLGHLDPIRESTSTTFEAGYKGVIGERVLVTADFWHSRKKNLVTPLTIATPLLLLNGQQTIGYLTQRFMQDLGWSQAQAQGTAVQLVCGGAEKCDKGLAAIPVGVISSDDVNANGAQILTTYFNVDDELKVYGTDLSAQALLTNEFSVTGTLSLVNKDEFETKNGTRVTLNAPKTKGSLALGYRGEENGLNAEVRARFNSQFPVMSGVYNGTGCLVSGVNDAAPGVEPCVDSSTLFDLTMGYRLPIQGASLQLNVQNLFNEKYRSFPGVPTIGRLALIRMKYEF